MTNVQVIVNPAAGRDVPVLAVLNSVFGRAVEWDVSVTLGRGDATRLTERAVESGAELIAVYGGDGTVGEAAAALVGRSTPMAILPGGTGNGVARFMGIPLDLRSAAALLVDGGAIRPMDVGDVNGRTFVLRGDVGFMAQAGAGTPRIAKDHLGKWAYFISAIHHRWLLEPSRYEVVADGVEREFDAVMLMVVNIGPVAFGRRPFVHDVRADDGLLDLLVLTRNDAIALTEVASSAVLGNASPMLHQTFRTASIRSASPQRTALDGEPIDAQSLDVRVLPRAVRLLVPRSAATREPTHEW